MQKEILLLQKKKVFQKKKVCTELAVAKIIDVHVSYGDGHERNTYSPIYAFEINGQEYKGTTGIFLAMGKKKKSYIYEDDNIVEEKAISLAWVADERICDGFYYATALKSFYKYLKNPELLEEKITPKEDIK